MRDSIFWGGLHLPVSTGTQHFGIIGAPGSGKSTSLALLMKSILPGIRPGSNRRALIFDAKRDIYAILIGLGLPPERIAILNPFDLRSAAWDMARDITSPAIAMEMGTILVPEKEELQPFFPEAARSLLGGVMESFTTLAPGRWTLRDVVLTLRHDRRLQRVLGSNPNTEALVRRYLGTGEMQKSVEATVDATIRRLTFVAAAWERATAKVSLQDFLREERIFLLGRSPSLNSTVQQINRAILHRLTQLILKGEEATRLFPAPQTWIIVDELRTAGRFDSIPSFMVEGRSKGACVVVGFQDLPGLIEVYGQHLAHEIFGACRNKAFLKLTEIESAKFASAHFGEQELELVNYTWNSSSTQSQSGKPFSFWQESARTFGIAQQKSRHVRPALPPSGFQRLPEATRYNGIAGYYDTASIGHPYFHVLSGPFLNRAVPNPARGIADLIDRPPEHEVLTEWRPADLERLGLGEFPELLSSPDKPPAEGDNPLNKLPKGKK
jgi:type IV secretory pathway TraG/TraD family ATPase VirD4